MITLFPFLMVIKTGKISQATSTIALLSCAVNINFYKFCRNSSSGLKMQGGAEGFNTLFLKHEMPGQQEANNFLEVNAKGISQYRNLTFYYL